MIKQLIVNLILFAAMLFLATQNQFIANLVREKRPLEASPVTYGEVIPDKEEYAPGDLIGFSFDRTCKTDEKLLPLPMLTNDSFENLNTGEAFPGSFLGRIVLRNGTEHLRALRRLSPDCTPGTYSFEGWVNVQGKQPTEPAFYFSRKFKVNASQTKETESKTK